ncbi:tRNA pseudouridine(55) synthase TruB [Sandaracinobacter sp. RS1-74]|uniref:tRNA pseudouridine(55) synthase TruB n=1 Tax=Sandaracinobacteroides sayramensis TaxID=2913411 RepID=UPI001EDBE69A|nr:tRNA pseudouridine(55) synthase TruB [Sandaracinobacteroides sayramensis]MCG2842242.1 tRNA pseudouridine(55) synthase TruB [Sandaracinobacteroides sayramensis]
MTGLNGWLVVDKPVGPTSAQVVGKLKWALRQGGHGKVKIGHGGTLDPLASGVLPIALGEATKLTGYLLNGPKSYRFTLRFGTATSTDDAEGEVVATSAVRPDEAAIRAALPAFTGPVRQRPPAYSALKVDGERAYARARAGEAVELAEREIRIHSLQLVQATAESATFDVHCSKGTYVRSLARDLALALGTVGHVAFLRRTAAGPFGLEQALSLDKCVELVQGPAPEQALLPLTAGLDDIPALAVDPDEAAALKQGKRLHRPHESPGQYIATRGSVPVALVELSNEDVKVLRGFNLP